jgi:transposase
MRLPPDIIQLPFEWRLHLSDLCGGALRRLGEDTDEILDLEPVVYKVVRNIQPKVSA